MNGELSALSFHILVALADRDQHGYGIMQDGAARTNGFERARTAFF